jgi:Rrf2 family protein
LYLGYEDAKMAYVSKTSQYGLKGLQFLWQNRESGFIKIDEIAEKQQIPANYLRKIFQRLIKNRILESGLGPKGGVKLSPESYDTSIAGIIEIIDGKPSFEECTLFGTTSCPKLDQCPLHLECNLFKKGLWQKLQNFKLSEL